MSNIRVSPIGGSCVLTVVLLLVSATTHAQTSSSTSQSSPEKPPPKETKATGVYTGREIFVQDAPVKKEPEPAARSVADSFLRNTRQHLGFSVGVSETYTPNIFVSPTDKTAVS